MTARDVVDVHRSEQSGCHLARQFSAPESSTRIPVPVTAPGNLQASLEFWIQSTQSETTPLLHSLPKGFVPKGDYILPVDQLLKYGEPRDGESKELEDARKFREETTCSIACQVFIPFMIAGMGTVAAGLLLDVVQHWNVFTSIPEMFVLVPALLGLKGNLEMTLASRISTLANVGAIDSSKEQWKMALGNICLLQCQSLVLALVASSFASIVGWTREGELNLTNVFILCTSSLITASAASFILGTATILVVVFSKKVNINPDNVAAPIAASLGDVVTLALLSYISKFLFEQSSKYVYAEISVLLFLICLVPLWALLSYQNPYTRHVLYSGWIPVISAVVISSGGGYILNFAVVRYKEIAACQPVINGVGGNLVAVQACRISTYLHQRHERGELPREELCVSPFVAWFGKSIHSRTCRILILLSIPGQLVFISCIHFLKSTYTPLTAQFLLFYLAASLLQIAILMYFAHCFIHWLWKWGMDPDNAAIPYLTAMGDLLGTGFLFLAFLALDVL